MTTARVLIVDDEPLARTGLRDLLTPDARVEVVDECKNAREALAAVANQQPDIVFLDIRMPGMDGLDLAAALRREFGARTPVILFVTAFEGHAVDAFDTAATDYILKPIDPVRLGRALDRALEQLQARRDADAGRRVLAVLAELDGTGPTPRPVPAEGLLERIAVTSGHRTTLLRVDEIDWIEARSYYARLHVGPRQYLVRRSMGTLERCLDRQKFARIHRSTIVNLDRVAELQPYDRRSYVVVLRDGRRLIMSRRRRRLLGFLLP